MTVVEDSEDDLPLVESARAGCLASFGKLVSRYQGQIRGYLVLRMDVAHEAEDIAQDVFLVAHAKLAEFDLSMPLGPWLRGIALNLLRNHQRKRRPFAIGGDAELARLVDPRVSERFNERHEPEIFAVLEICLRSSMRRPAGFYCANTAMELQRGILPQSLKSIIPLSR